MRRGPRHLLLAERVRLRRRRWRLAGFVFAIAGSVGLIAAQAGPGEEWAERARFGLLDALQPLIAAVRGPVAALGDRLSGTSAGAGHAVGDAGAQRDLEAWRQKAEALEAKLAELARLAEVAPAPRVPFVMAEVLGTGGRPERHEIVVGAGSDTGVTPGQAVMADGGFIGVVAAVGGGSARVRLIGDPGSKLSVLIGSALLPGRVTGGGGALLDLDMPGLDYQVSEGDRIVTSGDGRLLPRGLAVGNVVVVAQRLGVKPFADGRSRRYVAILTAGLPDVVTQETGAGPARQPVGSGAP